MAIEPYEFQAQDIEKLKHLRGRGIFSEMGTGKTPEGVLLSRGHDKTLVVAPMQVLEHWGTWFNEDGKDYIQLDPKNRNKSLREFTQKKEAVLGVHWEALRLMPELHQMGIDHVIADECHRAQNRKAQQTRALKKVKAGYKTALSGTPVTGAPNKYWSSLNWLYPNEFRSYWSFYGDYVDFEIQYPQGYHKIKGPKNEQHLLERVQPFSVRHLKKEQCCPHHPQGVMPWLPDKYYTPIYVDLTPQQRKAYNAMKEDMLAWVGSHEQTPLVAQVAIAQMMRLQQFACAYADIGEDNRVVLSEPSSKVDVVMQLIEDNPDESIVVFSQFNKLLHLLEARLKKAAIDYVTYTGENRSTRDTDKRRFIDGSARVFVGNIAAGGVGLDGLQQASSTVIFTDRLWSPALNKQAEDRLWRGGQNKAVQVIDIMARNTVDHGRHQSLEMTWEWIRKVLGDI